MKIIITGGTGFIGRRLAREMIRRNATVSIFSRHEHEALKSLGVTFFTGDIMNKGSLIDAFQGQDVVYHLAAEIDESSPDLRRINVGGTKMVVEACKAAGIKRIVFASAMGVLGESEEALAEDAPYAPATEYERTKMNAEKIIISSGVPYTIARMPPIYGPSKIWREIFHAAEKQYPIIGSGNNYWHIVYVDDVIEALLLMLRPAAKNQIYNIADADPHTYLEVYETIAKAMNIEMPTKHVPIWLANIGAYVYEAKCKMSGKTPKVTKTRASIRRLTRNRLVNIKKAEKDIDYAPKYTLEAGMKKTWEILKEIEKRKVAAQNG